MASIFIVKTKIKNPMEWYCQKMHCNSNWIFDEQLKLYHLESVYFKQSDDMIIFEDMSENKFFGLKTSIWITLAENKELIYGSYNEDGNAEFVHIKDGICVRDYRVYDFEIDTDKGDAPSFEDYNDVGSFIEDNLL